MGVPADVHQAGRAVEGLFSRPLRLCGILGNVSYAGDITREEAWKLRRDNPDAAVVDCRTDAEWRFVGVPDISGLGRDVVYVQWSGVDGKRNETFVDELIEAGVEPGDRPVVFLCR